MPVAPKSGRQFRSKKQHCVTFWKGLGKYLDFLKYIFGKFESCMKYSGKIFNQTELFCFFVCFTPQAGRVEYSSRYQRHLQTKLYQKFFLNIQTKRVK